MSEDSSKLDTLIRWLDVLQKGYAKPDQTKGCCRDNGTVYETKHYKPYIDAINKELAERLGIEDKVIQITNRRTD